MSNRCLHLEGLGGGTCVRCLEESLTAERAKVARLREALKREADYCYSYAAKYAPTDPERAKRHMERGDRLMKEVGDE